MSQANLKKSLGEAGAFFDDSHGENRLYDVLKALAESGETLNVTQAVIATAVLATLIVDRASKLGNLWVNLEVTGTAGSTVLEVKVNGTIVGAITVGNAVADDTSAGLALADLAGADLEAGDVVSLEVTTAPTAGTGLHATLRLKAVTVEA